VTILLIGGLFAVILLVYLLEIYGHLLRRRSKGEVMSDEVCYVPYGPEAPSPCGKCGSRWGADEWDEVTCKKCLRAKELAEKPYKALQAEVERLREEISLWHDTLDGSEDLPLDVCHVMSLMEKAKAEGGSE